MSDVVVYGTRLCPYCVAARRFFASNNIPFEDVQLDGNPRLRQDVMTRSGRHTVPQIWIGETHVGGYDDLDRMGKTGQLDKLLA